MSTLREKVARRMYEADAVRGDPSWANADSDEREPYYRMADVGLPVVADAVRKIPSRDWPMTRETFARWIEAGGGDS